MTDVSTPLSSPAVSARIDAIYDERRFKSAAATDRLFAALLGFEWLAAIAAALWVSPLAWAGTSASLHFHVWLAVVGGGLALAPPLAFARTAPGQVLTRHCIAIAQMAFGAIFIHLTGGRIETHFHVFGSLACLSFYRDWRVLATASAVVAVDHLARGALAPQSIFGAAADAASAWRWVEHAGWVAFIDAFLVCACVHGDRAERAAAASMAEMESAKAGVEESVRARTAELRESEERFRGALEHAAIGMGLAASDGCWLRVNPALCRLLGCHENELLTRTMTEFVHPDDRAAEEFQRLRLFAGKLAAGHLEQRWVRADGTVVQVMSSASLVRADNGTPVHLVIQVQDVTDRRNAEMELRRNERRYRTMVEANPAIVWSISPRREFDEPPAGWLAFTGQSVVAAAGRGWLDAVHPEDRDESENAWAAATEARSLLHIEQRVLDRHGEYRHMVARAMPVLADDATIQEWVGVHTDVHVQKEAEAALRTAKEAAEAASRAKGEFLANMSHEIRTPMNGVIGMTELMLGTTLSDEQRDMLGVVKSSGEALMSIINDILDFSKIEAGKLQLDPVPFLLRDALGDALKGLARTAHAKGLELVCDVDAEVPDAVLGDPGRLRQVVVNLVGNAIKFTERGEIVVRAEAEAATAAGVRVRFTVADTGIGIPRDKLQHVFEAFTQADGSTTRRFGGTGLGLTISRHLVEMMGGAIRADSVPGQGSTFRFDARFGHPRGSVALKMIRPTAELERAYALVVDDNATNRRVLVAQLQAMGALPQAVASASEAMQALRSAAAAGPKFQIMVLDAMMPDEDGFALAQKVLREFGESRPATVMLTSADRPGDAARCREFGVAAYLVKPAKPSELQTAILSAMSDRRPAAQAKLRPERAAPAEDGPSLRILLAEDNTVNQLVAVSLLRKHGHETVVVANGRDALAKLAAERFDLVLMDVQMPEMDGFAATEAIRKREAGTGVRLPIIAMTAHALKGDRERCLAAGMDGYVSKPFRWSDLSAAITAVKMSAAATPHRGPQIDIDTALALVEGNRALLGELADAFLDDIPVRLDEARAAAAGRDAACLRRAAHSLRGGLANLGARTAARAAGDLEALAAAGEFADATAALQALASKLDALRPELHDLAQQSPSTAGRLHNVR